MVTVTDRLSIITLQNLTEELMALKTFIIIIFADTAKQDGHSREQ